MHPVHFLSFFCFLAWIVGNLSILSWAGNALQGAVFVISSREPHPLLLSLGASIHLWLFCHSVSLIPLTQGTIWTGLPDILLMCKIYVCRPICLRWIWNMKHLVVGSLSVRNELCCPPPLRQGSCNPHASWRDGALSVCKQSRQALDGDETLIRHESQLNTHRHGAWRTRAPGGLLLDREWCGSASFWQ